ncbi:Rrp15p-domain-containing protein [Biscogniauxia marginata]|nr:Rrp15p-domain-containing protein [Biscogniauxia marginata]
MAGPTSRKRNHKDVVSSKLQRPKKKQKKSREYHSDSEGENTNTDFQPVNLLDSDDEDLDNIAVDDIASFSGSSSDSGADTDADSRSRPAAVRQRNPHKSSKAANDDSGDDESAGQSSLDDEGDEEDEDEDEDEDDAARGDGDGANPTKAKSKKSKSKRNDSDAFATSMSKILSSKLSGARKADPVLSRSADAHQAAKQAVDAALEAKARKYLRERKRAALEKGRVKDVLAGSGGGPPAGEKGGLETATSTAEVVQTEKRLRKVAHRGVVMLFRAVREAQERAVEAEKGARKDGIFGVARREEKVNEMSRQGFLDLIAGGGGKLKKGGLEEA